MAHPNQDWLLEPIIPAPPAVPNLARELYELAGMADPPQSARPVAHYPSGTWRLGARAELEEPDEANDDRFATSDPEAPTVRPGSLHALKTG